MSAVQSWSAPRALRGPWRVPVLLFCLAMAIRLWGLSFGLPDVYSSDEINKRDTALHLAEKRFVHRTSHPSFLYNSLFVIFSLAKSFTPEWSKAQYLYAGRVWMAILGSLTVVALYRLGTLWGPRIGFQAALLLAIVPLHTAASRYIKEDVPLALMTTVTILLIAVYLRQPSRPALSAAALFTGISFSTKYSGLLMILPLLLSVLVAARRARRQHHALLFDLGLTIMMFWVGFFLISPIYLVYPDSLLSGVLNQWVYANTGHRDGISHDPWSDLWLYYIRTGLIPGLTWPVFLFAVAGLVLLIRSRDGWLITVTVAWLYLMFEHGRAKPYPFSARYVLPLVPLLCLSAAVAVERTVVVLGKWLPIKAAYALLALLVYSLPLTKSMFIADEALHDSRIAARAWMEENVPQGSVVVVVGEGRRALSAAAQGKGWRLRTTDRLDDLHTMERAGQRPYIVVSSITYQRYLDRPDAAPVRTRLFRAIMNEYDLVREFRPRWLTYGFHSPVIRLYRPGTKAQKLSRAAVSSEA